MGASCPGPLDPGSGSGGNSSGRQQAYKETPEELDRKTIKLAVQGPIIYPKRRFHFAGRSRGGTAGGPNKVHINQDNLLYFNLRKHNMHVFLVLDGSGPDGDLAAFFVKEKLLINFAQLVIPNHRHLSRLLTKMFRVVDEMLCDQEDMDIAMSGVTLVMGVLDADGITIANCGDCRVVFGFKSRKRRRLKCEALSVDHTLRQAGERKRCLATGALIRTLAQLSGTRPVIPNENWDFDVGNKIDTSGDPPRLFEEKLHPNEPAVAFTRALGCTMAKACGVVPKPQVKRIAFSRSSRMVIFGTNGVFEFITNQGVIDLATSAGGDAEVAAEMIIDHAYRRWIQFENQADDITVIVVMIDHTTATQQALANAYDEDDPMPTLDSMASSEGGSAILIQSLDGLTDDGVLLEMVKGGASPIKLDTDPNMSDTSVNDIAGGSDDRSSDSAMNSN